MQEESISDSDWLIQFYLMKSINYYYPWQFSLLGGGYSHLWACVWLNAFHTYNNNWSTYPDQLLHLVKEFV